MTTLPWSMLSRKIGIDLGTSSARVYVKGEGVVHNEPAGAATLHNLIGKAQPRPRLFRPDVVVSVRSGIASGERRAVTDEAMAAGARQVWLIDEPLAAAMGAGLPIAGTRASAICELGAASTEIAVIHLSGTVAQRSVDVGGRSLDAAIAARFGTSQGEAERLKIDIGSARPMAEPLRARVGDVEVSSNDIAEAIQAPLAEIAAAIIAVLAEVPPRIADGLRDRGLVLSGGGAQLRGLDRFLAERVGLPTAVTPEPQTSVVRGTGLALDNFEVLKRNQTYLR